MRSEMFLFQSAFFLLTSHENVTYRLSEYDIVPICYTLKSTKGGMRYEHNAHFRRIR